MVHLSKMSSPETKMLNDCAIDFEILEPNSAYLLKPHSIRYKPQIVLIVKDSNQELYTMLLFIDDELKRERDFKYRGNINNIYSGFYQLGVRLINNSKTSKNENA